MEVSLQHVVQYSHAGKLPQLFKSCADPGNLLRTDNGRLGYLDFGMMADIEPKIRR